MSDLVLLTAESVVLVKQFLIVGMQGQSLLLQLLDLNEFGVEGAFQFSLFLLHFSQLVGSVAQLGPKGVNFLLEFVDRLDGEFELELTLLVSLGLSQTAVTVSADSSLVFSMSSTR